MNPMPSQPRLGTGDAALDPACVARTIVHTPELSTTLGFVTTYLGKGEMEAQMKIGPQCCRAATEPPMLHGGVSLAFAENCAGIGSMCICPLDVNPCGIQVTANHVHMAYLGETLTAKAHLVHQSRTLHLWEINIYNEQDKLISSVRVTNMLVKAR